MSRRPNTLNPIKLYGFALYEVNHPDYPSDRVVVARPPGQQWWNAYMTEAFPIRLVPVMVEMAKQLEAHGA